MSHFAVLVVGGDPIGQLAPFQQNNMDDCPEEYLEFHDLEDQLVKEYENDSRKVIVLADGTYKSPYAKEFRVPNPDDPFDGLGFSSSTKYKYPEGSVEREIPFKEFYPTFEAFTAGWRGHKNRDPKKNRYGFWENPNYKWDYHQLGGRYTGFFKMKNGDFSRAVIGRPGVFKTEPRPGWADQALKKDIDFEGMRDHEGEEAGKRWDKAHQLIAGRSFKAWTEVREMPEFKDNIDAARDFYHAQDVCKDACSDLYREFLWNGLDEFVNISRDEYIQQARDRAGVSFAILKDGEWYERGSMGWWGNVTDEEDHVTWNKKVAALLDELPDDTLLSAYDCHI